LNKEALLEKIDMNFVDNLCQEFMFDGLELFKSGEKLQVASIQSPNNISRFFFYMVTAMNYHFIQVLNYYMKLNETFRRYDKELKKMEPSNPRYSMIKMEVEKKEHELIVYRVLIDWPERNQYVQKATNFLLKNILQQFGSVSSGEAFLTNEKGLQYITRIPVQFLTNVCTYHNCLANFREKYFKETDSVLFTYYFQFLQILMANPLLLTNPSDRNTIFDLYFFWGMVDKNFPPNLAKNKTVHHES